MRGFHHEAWRRVVMVWGCFAGDTVCDLFRIQGILNQYGYHSILQWYALPSGLSLAGLSFFFFGGTMTKKTPPDCVRAIWPRRRVMECCIRWPGLHNHPTSTQLWWFGMSRTAEWKKSSHPAYVGTPSRLLENHSRWNWLRECQECAMLSSRQRMAILKSLKFIFVCVTLVFVTTWFHMCYFIVLIPSLLFYNLENSKNKEKPLNE